MIRVFLFKNNKKQNKKKFFKKKKKSQRNSNFSLKTRKKAIYEPKIIV